MSNTCFKNKILIEQIIKLICSSRILFLQFGCKNSFCHLMRKFFMDLYEPFCHDYPFNSFRSFSLFSGISTSQRE